MKSVLENALLLLGGVLGVLLVVGLVVGILAAQGWAAQFIWNRLIIEWCGASVRPITFLEGALTALAINILLWGTKGPVDHNKNK